MPLHRGAKVPASLWVVDGVGSCGAHTPGDPETMERGLCLEALPRADSQLLTLVTLKARRYLGQAVRGTAGPNALRAFSATALARSARLAAATGLERLLSPLPTVPRQGHFPVEEASLCPGQSRADKSRPFLAQVDLQYFIFQRCPWLRDVKVSLAGTARPC